MNKHLKITLYFIVIYSGLCFVSLNRHSHANAHTYHAELWADKAGYNVYLPATFIYNKTSSFFPESFVAENGYGFEVDSITHKVITKYPYGVSLLQSPFWLVAHLLSSDQTGYSFYYQKSVDFAGCFYFTLGLFLLFFCIKDYRSIGVSIAITSIIALSTGIFYYGIFETGMSHVYSFCCLSGILFLFFTKRESKIFTKLIWLSILSSLFIMIRPVNVLFIFPALFFLFYYSKTLTFSDLKQLGFPQIMVLCTTAVLIVFPQLLYYKYAFGSFLSNSYQKEPFFFPSLNRIFSVLISPNNGVLVYYPVILILLLFSILKKSDYTKLILLSFLIYVFLYASWWSLSLGCGFGHRAVNDIILLFFIPLCFSDIKTPKAIVALFFLCAIINLKFIFSYDGCLYKSDNWDYTEYISILFGEFK